MNDKIDLAIRTIQDNIKILEDEMNKPDCPYVEISGEIEQQKLIISALKEKQEREQMRCKNCKYSEKVDKNADVSIPDKLFDCKLLHGNSKNRTWIKYKKQYVDYSLVWNDDFCSYFEPKNK